jgi:hypothetical protein
MNLADLLQRADVWRGEVAPPQSGIASGFASLDAQLAGGGWPLGALSEILSEHQGIGELRLLLPALRRVMDADRWLVLVTPPYVPYAPALARAGIDLARVLVVHDCERRDALWAAEQSLRAGACGAVLAWALPVDGKRLRRLQLAAERGQGLGVLFRASRHAREASPAALRLRLEPAGTRLAVSILKRRGGWPLGPIVLEMNHAVAMPAPAGSRAGRLHARQRRT